MRISKTAPNRGAQELLAYIRRVHGSVPAFAAANNLDRIKVQKAIRGDLRRLDVQFALDIDRATGGAVAMTLWTEEAPADPDEPPASEPTPLPGRDRADTPTGTG